jgi:hypothetical protein
LNQTRTMLIINSARRTTCVLTVTPSFGYELVRQRTPR